MTRMRWGVGAVAGLLISSSGALAAEEAGKQPKNPQTVTSQKEGTFKQSELRTVTLTVKEVDAKNHRVTFEAKVTPEANLTESGQPIKLDQLKEGDTVRASMNPKTGDVVRIEVTPAPAKK
jgi:hypothetical protein